MLKCSSEIHVLLSRIVNERFRHTSRNKGCCKNINLNQRSDNFLTQTKEIPNKLEKPVTHE